MIVPNAGVKVGHRQTKFMHKGPRNAWAFVRGQGRGQFMGLREHVSENRRADPSIKVWSRAAGTQCGCTRKVRLQPRRRSYGASGLSKPRNRRAIARGAG